MLFPSRTAALILLALVGCDRSDSQARPTPSATVAPGTSSAATPTMTTASASASATSDDPLAALSTGPVIREEASVTVDGVTEKWRLEWTRTPTPDCIDPATFATCPCAAFAFGEKGDLDLVRARPGAVEERLHLTPLFDGGARLRRWPVTRADTGKKPDVADLVSRPIETVMKIGDYDHDGRATEMVLVVGSEPCGHQPGVVVGISRSNPTLHAFASNDKPGAPLVLQHPEDWEKVRAKPAVDLVEIACGDHGADSATSLHVTADGDLHATESTKKCP